VWKQILLGKILLRAHDVTETCIPKTAILKKSSINPKGANNSCLSKTMSLFQRAKRNIPNPGIIIQRPTVLIPIDRTFQTRDGISIAHPTYKQYFNSIISLKSCKL